MNHITLNCLQDIEISRYIDNNLTKNEALRIDAHLNKCLYCLHIVSGSIASLEKDIDNIEYDINTHKLLSIIKKKLRENTILCVEDTILHLLETTAKNRDFLANHTIHHIRDLIKEAFSYPCPHFDPVFGDAQSRVLSPYGKVTFPVRFEWTSHEQADTYKLSLNDRLWEGSTTSTVIQLDQSVLQYNCEYMWSLNYIQNEETIDEVSGFFWVGSEEAHQEINHVESVLSALDSNSVTPLLLGAFLEVREFYIDAIYAYKNAYNLNPSPAIAYRIATCYHHLELEELCNEWNKLIIQWEGSL